MNIKVTTEQELVELAQEGIHITANLRHFTKLWEQQHGVEAKQRKKYWEEKADEFIQRLKVKEHRFQKEIKIEIDGDNMEKNK